LAVFRLPSIGYKKFRISTQTTALKISTTPKVRDNLVYLAWLDTARQWTRGAYFFEDGITIRVGIRRRQSIFNIFKIFPMDASMKNPLKTSKKFVNLHYWVRINQCKTGQ
jgi:hypothetical protein